MMQEASGDNSFEIIEKTQNDPHNIPDAAPVTVAPPIPMYNPGNVGNLLSSVPPPSALPTFITPAPIAIPPTIPQPPQQQPIMPPVPIATTPLPPINLPIGQQPPSANFYPTTFSAAIPPSKGTALGTIPPANTSVPLTGEIVDESQSGLFDWMKGAVPQGRIISKLAEKARNSVNSMITTLDPQMREFIYSGGDMDIIVASDKEIKISAIREAFQNVFGKATVTGIAAQAANVAAQPVGFAAGAAAANDRIKFIQANPNTSTIPTVAVENFLLEIDESWYDLGVLILNDPVRQIQLQTFTQMTPIPSTIANLAKEETPADYPLSAAGFSVPVGQLLANNLQVSHTEYHEALCGISRRTILLNAAKALAGMYKIHINQMS